MHKNYYSFSCISLDSWLIQQTKKKIKSQMQQIQNLITSYMTLSDFEFAAFYFYLYNKFNIYIKLTLLRSCRKTSANASDCSSSSCSIAFSCWIRHSAVSVRPLRNNVRTPCTSYDTTWHQHWVVLMPSNALTKSRLSMCWKWGEARG